MDTRLYEAGHLAIPLLNNEGHSLNPQPNFLIINKISGRAKAEIPTMGEMVVTTASYKIVYREILEANEQLGRGEDVREVIYEIADQYVPIIIFPALGDYSYLLQSLQQVNGMLSLFQFRGCLSGFQLIVDEDKVTEIITPVTTTQNITTTTVSITTTTEQVTTTENITTTTEPITTTQL